MEWLLPLKFSPEEKKQLLTLARETLAAAFSGDPQTALTHFRSLLPKDASPSKKHLPCFVSLFTQRKRLRGCIGALATQQPLYENVFEFAQRAAFEDPRFPPLKEEELAQLKIEITVLGPSQPLPSLEQLTIGKHGLVVEGGGRRGVFLAQVAVEWKWGKKEFLDQTCLKAGLAPELLSQYQVFYFEEIAFSDSNIEVNQ